MTSAPDSRKVSAGSAGGSGALVMRASAARRSSAVDSSGAFPGVLLALTMSSSIAHSVPQGCGAGNLGVTP